MSLRIFVQVWCEIDPALNVRIDRHTGKPVVDEGDVLLRVSPLGRSGVRAALDLGQVQVTAFALGGGHIPALRHALAAGAQRAVALSAAGADPEAIPLAALADWLRRQPADLVIADRLAGLVAGRLGWAHLAGLADLSVAEGQLRAVRYLGQGDREVVTARLPAAVRLQDESVHPDYVARARIQAIAESQIERETLAASERLAEPEDAGPLQPTRPRVRLGKPVAPAAKSGSDRLQALLGLGKSPAAPAAKREEKAAATPEQMAEEFVRYLVHHNLLPERHP